MRSVIDNSMVSRYETIESQQFLEEERYERHFTDFGVTPLFGLRKADDSILITHMDMDAYEGPFEKAPFLTLHMCTGHVGRIHRKGADGSEMDGILRPGSFGVTLPNTEAEGYWPRAQVVTIMVGVEHLGAIGDDGVQAEDMEAASTVVHRDPLVSSVMSALWRDAEAHGLTTAFFDHGLTLVCDRLAAFRCDQTTSFSSTASPLPKIKLKRVLELIECRLGTDIRVIELANECDQGVRNFTRSFRASTGYAPFEYVTMRRMENAKHLLLVHIPVTEVAFQVGYSNPSKFAAAFRRFCGCSPTQWRKAHR